MAAPPTTVTDYCAVIAKSKLIPEAEVQAIHRRWQADGKADDADVDAFRKHLVARKLLTEYQAALLQRGHTDGYIVGGYVIQDRLGKGASAGVYRAVHTSGQVVALKVLARSKGKEANVLTRFQREGRLLCQLDHPNVVRAFQLGQAGATHFIVMEHLDGETLDEVLARRKKLPYQEACRLAVQALRGLQHLHERSMVHRDVKPANLMLTAPEDERATGGGGDDTTLRSTVKILDIGLGRELFDDDGPEAADPGLTSEGAILGTPDYIAPEQARDARSADIRSDVYSLGCVLFHLIAGRPPFTDKNTMMLMVKHATERLPKLADLVPGTPAALQAVLDRMTAKRPEDRYQTPNDAAEALRPFLPSATQTAEFPPVNPEFRKWLETESGTDEPPPEVAKRPTGAAPAQSGVAKVPVASRPTAPSAPPLPTAKPARAAAPLIVEEPMIDVELVSLPVPLSDPFGGPAPAPVEEEPRSMLDWDRRDFLMLGFGAGGMLLAMGTGYGLSKLLRSATRDTPPDAEPPTEAGK